MILFLDIIFILFNLYSLSVSASKEMKFVQLKSYLLDNNLIGFAIAMLLLVVVNNLRFIPQI